MCAIAVYRIVLQNVCFGVSSCGPQPACVYCVKDVRYMGMSQHCLCMCMCMHVNGGMHMHKYVCVCMHVHVYVHAVEQISFVHCTVALSFVVLGVATIVSSLCVVAQHRLTPAVCVMVRDGCM